MKRICHMSSSHSWNDVRIFIKECQTLAEAGYEVYLVAEGIDRKENGVHVVGCGEKPSSRKKRMRMFAKKVYEKAIELDCEIYHIHDPELLPYGIKLKKMGKKVIFDSHEDVPGQILDKEWIPAVLRKLIALCYRQYESYCAKRFDAVIAATPYIADKFRGRCRKVIIVNNYPRTDEIIFHGTPFADREAIICYAGGINAIRGEKIMVKAMEDISGTLILAGSRDDIITN